MALLIFQPAVCRPRPSEGLTVIILTLMIIIIGIIIRVRNGATSQSRRLGSPGSSRLLERGCADPASSDRLGPPFHPNLPRSARGDFGRPELDDAAIRCACGSQR